MKLLKADFVTILTRIAVGMYVGKAFYFFINIKAIGFYTFLKVNSVIYRLLVMITDKVSTGGDSLQYPTIVVDNNFVIY